MFNLSSHRQWAGWGISAVAAVIVLSTPSPALAGSAALSITGTPGPDLLVGSANNDRIVARNGDDVLRGRGGADHLMPGRGDDTVYGGWGSDDMEGTRGQDVYFGGRGDDQVFSGGDAFSHGYGNDIAVWGTRERRLGR